jgi:16S rRNA (uracil1498-N3)-methyltransferase
VDRLFLVFFNLAKVIFLCNNLVAIVKIIIHNHSMLKKDKLINKKPIPRLFTANFNYQTQQKQQKILLDFVDFNYLINVLRLNIGNKVIIFNQHQGSFLAKISIIYKKQLELEISQHLTKSQPKSNIILAFALIKNVRLDYLASKATEMGVGCFQPLITQRTVVADFNNDRFFANVKEATEQCGRNLLPTIEPLRKLATLLSSKKPNDILLFCCETGLGKQASKILPNLLNTSQNQQIFILIGPEGGFSQEEQFLILQQENCFALNLGPRILRSDTAIVVALALVQEFLGDFYLPANFYIE